MFFSEEKKINFHRFLFLFGKPRNLFFSNLAAFIYNHFELVYVSKSFDSCSALKRSNLTKAACLYTSLHATAQSLNKQKHKMASDLKRIPAPESIPYHLTARQKTKSYKEKLAITLENGKRQDERRFDEARKICEFIFEM